MKNIKIIITSVTFIVVLAFLFWEDMFPRSSAYDVVTTENAKIPAMLNEQIERVIKDHTKSEWYPGYSEESKQSTIDFLKSVKSIESYARYGVTSTKARNNLLLNIEFKDGSKAEDVYTGHTVSGYTGPALLMKVNMSDGKAASVITNGVEKKGSPDWIVNDLYIIIDKAVAYDITQHRGNYFPPDKTKADFRKEWEEK